MTSTPTKRQLLTLHENAVKVHYPLIRELVPGNLYFLDVDYKYLYSDPHLTKPEQPPIKAYTPFILLRQNNKLLEMLFGDKLCYCREETIRRDIWENSIGLWTIKET